MVHLTPADSPEKKPYADGYQAGKAFAEANPTLRNRPVFKAAADAAKAAQPEAFDAMWFYYGFLAGHEDASRGDK